VFVFYRKGKPLKESERHIITSEGTIRRLVIKKATLEDQTDYTCVAVNVKTSSKLKLQSKLPHTAAVICHILKILLQHFGLTYEHVLCDLYISCSARTVTALFAG
jgi:hypothetical protein